MKRIILVVGLALLMATFVVLSALPAIAAPPNCEHGQDQAASNAGERQDVAQVEKHQENLSDCLLGLPPGEGHDK